jgi:hypothetical protein
VPGSELCGDGTEEGLTRFERPSESQGRGFEAKSDGFCVLVSCVEGIAQIHKEGVAVPSEMVLDIGVGEPGAV